MFHLECKKIHLRCWHQNCTCNGHNPAGLAPVDLALDASLRPGDVIATTDGLAAYSGIRVGYDQVPDFTPGASYPSLGPEVRARLNDMKVAPARADMAQTTRQLPRWPARRCRRQPSRRSLCRAWRQLLPAGAYNRTAPPKRTSISLAGLSQSKSGRMSAPRSPHVCGRTFNNRVSGGWVLFAS